MDDSLSRSTGRRRNLTASGHCLSALAAVRSSVPGAFDSHVRVHGEGSWTQPLLISSHGSAKARQRTLQLVADLDDDQLLGPRLEIVNPLLWEIGHVAWFQEKWVLRRGGEPSIRADADALYDSAAVAHDRRWELPLPDRDDTLRYMAGVLERVIERCRKQDPEDMYFVPLALFHEDMHGEAFTYTRQTLGYPPPRLSVANDHTPPSNGSRRRPAGRCVDSWRHVRPSAHREVSRSVFDNEKWSHPVTIRPFDIARAAVTQKEFVAFVEDEGYRRREFWDDEGWRARGNRAFTPSTGGERPAAAGNVGISIAGYRWSRTGLCCTYAGTRPMPIAGGPVADYPAKPSGRSRRQSDPFPTGGAYPRARHGSRGVTICPLRPTPTWIASPWDAGMSAIYPLVTAPWVAAR